jgi:hypothetical protein
MCVPTSEVGYTLATTRRGDHEVHKEHVVALGENYLKTTCHRNHSNTRYEFIGQWKTPCSKVQIKGKVVTVLN